MKPHIQKISAQETYDLRHRVLRPNQTIHDVQWPSDQISKTVHFGCFIGDLIVGIVTLSPKGAPQEGNPNGMQLRGMAIDTAHQKKGLGRLLVQACLDHGRSQGATYIWCNARVSACEFYSSLGFKIVSDEFEVPDVGLHKVMKLDLGSPSSL